MDVRSEAYYNPVYLEEPGIRTLEDRRTRVVEWKRSHKTGRRGEVIVGISILSVKSLYCCLQRWSFPLRNAYFSIVIEYIDSFCSARHRLLDPYVSLICVWERGLLVYEMK